jgi:hypothetical protein
MSNLAIDLSVIPGDPEGGLDPRLSIKVFWHSCPDTRLIGSSVFVLPGDPSELIVEMADVLFHRVMEDQQVTVPNSTDAESTAEWDEGPYAWELPDVSP